jgi:uncharacterized membrane protein HdeD (DUF308 family)
VVQWKCWNAAETWRRITNRRETIMIVLGIILLIIGFITHISILWTLGIILLVIGLILAVLGAAGREVGGRRHWY